METFAELFDTMSIMRKKAIFSILDTSAFGGAEQYMFSHLRFLSHQGYDVVLATNNAKVKAIMLSRLTENEKKQFQIIRAPYRLDAIGNWKGLVKFFLALPRAIIWVTITMRNLKDQYDKVICLWPGYSDRSMFSPIAYYFQFPLIWIEFGTLETIYKRNWGFPKLLFQFSSSFPLHVITSSAYTKKSIVKNSRFTSADVSIVYPGTEIYSEKKIISYKAKATKWIKENNLTKKKIFTVVGRLANENEIDMVIKGYSYFLKNYGGNGTILQIIGDGPQRIELQTLVIDLMLQDKVLFRGFVTEEEKQMMLSATTVFIFPRAWELDGFGMTTIEAMSFGIPILTTNFGPQIEIVTDKKEGFRYKPHDSRDLALQLNRMMKLSSQKRINMGKLGLKKVTEFSESISNNKMLSIIKHYEDQLTLTK